MPATFTIAPSGARLPFSTTTPPVGDIAFDTGRTTSCLGREAHIGEVFGDRPAGHGHAVAVQIAAVEQRLHQHRHAADIVQIFHYVTSARLQVADIRRALEDFADRVQVEIDPGLVGDRWQVQTGIGRAAGRGDDGRGVFERFAGHDVARAQVAAQQLHDRLARRLGIGVARIVGRRRAGRAGQGQPDRLGHRGHRIRGEQPAARAGRGQATHSSSCSSSSVSLPTLCARPPRTRRRSSRPCP